jgi:hypothetical protein
MSDLIHTDRTNRSNPDKESSTPGLFEIRRAPDEADQGPVIVAIALLIFFAVLIALFTTAVRSAEEQPANTQNAQPFPPKDWKPPVAKPIPAPLPIDAERSKQILEKWGVEIISLNLTAAGYMIDFRFRVHDVEKSKVFFDSRVKPYLHVAKSNAKLPVPMAAKVGAFRTTNRGNNIKPNKIYYMVFGNPDAHVKSGERVTMIIGDFKAEDMIVH